MQVTVDIDCTPEEARVFLGLPDVKPMQERLMREMQESLTASLKMMEPEAMLKTWLPMAFKGFEQWQEMFASQINPRKRS